MIKNFIFDMDGVLRGIKDVLLTDLLPQNLKDLYYDKYAGIKLENFRTKWLETPNSFEDWDAGKIDARELRDRIIRFVDDPEEVSRAFLSGYLDIKYRYIYPETLALVEKLKKHGFKVFVLSNMGFEGVEIIKQLIDLSIFDGVYFSCLVGLIKPNSDCYEFALKKFGARAEESIFIDDKKANLPPFESLGGKSFWFDRSNPAKSVSELEDIAFKNNN